MGLEELKQEILNKAKNSADTIIKSAEEEAKKIVNDAKAKVEEYKKAQHSEMKRKIENMEKLYMASANAVAKQILLEKKKQLIEDVFKEAKKQLIKQRINRKYIEKLLKKAEKEIEINRVYCNKSDTTEIKKYNTKEEETYGIIAENKDGTMRVDLSFDTVLEDIKAKSLHEIADILFKVK